MNIIIHDKALNPVTVIDLPFDQVSMLQKRGCCDVRVFPPFKFPVIAETYDAAAKLELMDFRLQAFKTDMYRHGIKIKDVWLYQCEASPAEICKLPVSLLPGQMATMEVCHRLDRQLGERMNQLQRDRRG